MPGILALRDGDDRRVHLAVALALTVAVILLALALGPGLTASAAAADRGTVTHAGGGTTTIAAGDTATSVFTIGGHLVIAGTVRDTVVGVDTRVVLEPGAVVGASHGASSTSLVLIGGSLTKQSGALVRGNTTTVSGSQVSAAWKAGVVAPVSHALGALSLIIWGALTILYVLLAVTLAALAPRQLAAVGRRVTARPLPTFGWGLLVAAVIVPVVSVLLVVSIIGLLAIVPWGIVVLAVYVTGSVAIAALVGGWLTRRLGGRVGLVVATLIGVVVVRLVELIPIVGAVVSGLLAILAFGAAAMAFWDWRRGTGGSAPMQLAGQETAVEDSGQRAA
jgi:hypothetical protein